jgi:hypothetical protein
MILGISFRFPKRELPRQCAAARETEKAVLLS